MPRGSKPGERRGARQKGTPNKATAEVKVLAQKYVPAGGLCSRQGSVEPRKDCGVTQHIVHGHEASAEPNRSDALCHLFADARRFFFAAD
jgi:hypothetical protein